MLVQHVGAVGKWHGVKGINVLDQQLDIICLALFLSRCHLLLLLLTLEEIQRALEAALLHLDQEFEIENFHPFKSQQAEPNFSY